MILGWSKLQALADDKINLTEKLKWIFGRVANIVGKGENAGYQHFLLFPQCFQKMSSSELFKAVKGEKAEDVHSQAWSKFLTKN